jgi:hypothetical protein
MAGMHIEISHTVGSVTVRVNGVVVDGPRAGCPYCRLRDVLDPANRTDEWGCTAKSTTVTVNFHCIDRPSCGIDHAFPPSSASKERYYELELVLPDYAFAYSTNLAVILSMVRKNVRRLTIDWTIDPVWMTNVYAHLPTGVAIATELWPITTIDALTLKGLDRDATRALCDRILEKRDDLNNPTIHGVFNGKIHTEHAPGITCFDMMCDQRKYVAAVLGPDRRSARIARMTADMEVVAA